MVDMGDDAEVADIFHHRMNLNQPLYPKGRQFRYCPFWAACTATYTQSAGKANPFLCLEAVRWNVLYFRVDVADVAVLFRSGLAITAFSCVSLYRSRCP
jgi:hypothetical protein